METQVARRRINTIAAHFALTDDISITNVLPMVYFRSLFKTSPVSFPETNCNGSLNTVVRRCDNGVLFARQGSASQAYFMRQAPLQEVSPAQSAVPHKSSGFESSYNAFEAPLFSRPVSKEPNLLNIGQPIKQGSILTMPEPPKFAKPSRKASGRSQLHSKKKVHYSESDGLEWSPRMDVAESGRNYVMTVELPGVNTNDIRVEVDNQKLTVRGRRSTQYWKMAGISNGSISAYHKREISQGPYQVVWPLSTDVNKDSVSAEFS
ncbi:Small heat shock protein C2 [Morella rubra]|uniref:Small heat shock protein C2 n=1 Tax=Morella rubra TaxID=262757 RepID=A0A6A1V228_9ROSI|nr:Small heat shock protein C2 [Morella rubra]